MRPISQSLAIRPGIAAAGRLTATRRDGVGGPTIQPAHGTADREEIQPAAVDAAPLPTAALVREAIDTALDSLDALENQARDTARRFRRHALDEAQLGLTHLVQSTQTLLKLAAMTATAAGTDIESVCETHGIAAEQQTQNSLSQLIGRQLERDWHGLARVIDQSFVAALGAWRAVFEAIGGPTDPYGHAA